MSQPVKSSELAATSQFDNVVTRQDRGVLPLKLIGSDQKIYDVTVFYNFERNFLRIAAAGGQHLPENMKQRIEVFFILNPSVPKRFFENKVYEIANLSPELVKETIPFWTKSHHILLSDKTNFYPRDTQEKSVFRQAVKRISVKTNEQFELFSLLFHQSQSLRRRLEQSDADQKLQLTEVETALADEELSGRELFELTKALSECEQSVHLRQKQEIFDEEKYSVMNVILKEPSITTKIRLLNFLCDTGAGLSDGEIIQILRQTFQRRAPSEIHHIIVHLSSINLTRVLTVSCDTAVRKENPFSEHVLSCYHKLDFQKKIELARTMSIEDHLIFVTASPENLVRFCECVNSYTMLCLSGDKDDEINNCDVFINIIKQFPERIIAAVICYFDMIFLLQLFRKSDLCAAIGLQVIHEEDLCLICGLMDDIQQVKFLSHLTRTENKNNCFSVLRLTGAAAFTRAINNPLLYEFYEISRTMENIVCMFHEQGTHSSVIVEDKIQGEFSVTFDSRQQSGIKNLSNRIQTRYARPGFMFPSSVLTLTCASDYQQCLEQIYSPRPRNLPVSAARTAFDSLTDKSEDEILAVGRNPISSSGQPSKPNRVMTPSNEQLSKSIGLISRPAGTPASVNPERSDKFIVYQCKDDGACAIRAILFIKEKNSYWLTQADKAQIIAHLKHNHYDKKITEAIKEALSEIISIGLFEEVLSRAHLPESLYRHCIESGDFTLYSHHGIASCFDKNNIQHKLTEENLCLIADAIAQFLYVKFGVSSSRTDDKTPYIERESDSVHVQVRAPEDFASP